VKHGGYSRRNMRGPWARERRNLFDRIRPALGLPKGATAPVAVKVLVERAAWYRAVLVQSYEWRLEQPDPVFRDRGAGELHPVIAREEEWMSAYSRLMAQLPIDGGGLLDDDLPALLRGGRRG
jgi:hypothetical protein